MIRLAVRVTRARAQEALAGLLVISPGGLEEVDVDERTVEYVLYGAAGELPSLAALRTSLGESLVALRTSEIADDWAERWRAFHKPIVLAERLYVRPPWHPPLPKDRGLIDLVIEPGQAFGTGAHATTRLCLELLVELERAGAASGPLLDVGCGSGVLAIAAAQLGWSPVIAVDNDAESISATRSNAALNGLAIDARLADLQADALPPAATIVANLLRPLLLALSERLEQPVAFLVASGLLSAQGDELSAELAASHRLHERRRRRDGDWLALLFERA